MGGCVMVFLLSIAAFAAYSTGQGDEVVVSDAGLRAGRIAGFDHSMTPPPAPTTTVPPATTPQETEESVAHPSNGTTLEPSAVQNLVEQYFLPADVSRAVRVAWCSSHFETDRVSTSGRVGLFQHSPAEWSVRAEGARVGDANPQSPGPNAAAAAWEVYDGSGWAALTCSG